MHCIAPDSEHKHDFILITDSMESSSISPPIYLYGILRLRNRMTSGWGGHVTSGAEILETEVDVNLFEASAESTLSHCQQPMKMTIS